MSGKNEKTTHVMVSKSSSTVEQTVAESTEGSQEHQAAGPNKIQKILEKHQEWLNALGTEGTRASLDQTKNPAAAELNPHFQFDV